MESEKFKKLVGEVVGLLPNWGVEILRVSFREDHTQGVDIFCQVKEDEEDGIEESRKISFWPEDKEYHEFPMVMISIERKFEFPLPAIASVLVAAIHHRC